MKRCTYCHAEGARWTQFPWGHCLACDACKAAKGGWRRGEGPPVAITFPKDEGTER